MDLRNIKTFLRVASLGSISRAAEELDYAQSTVTAQIQQLERELGFPLFDRIGKRLSITAPGQAFLRYANEICALTQKAGELGNDPKEMAGTLRVGVLESLLFSVLPGILPTFKREFPNVEVQLNMGQAEYLLTQLKQNRLDMVYLSADRNTDPELCCAYQRREELVFLTAPDHPAANRRIGAAELFEYEFLVTERSGICYRRLRELAASRRLTLRHGMVVDSTVVIASLLKQGMGLAFLPEYSVWQQLERGELARVAVQLPRQTYYSQLLYHKSKWLAPFMEQFIALLREARPETE